MSKIELKIDADGVVGIDPAAAAVVNGKQDMGFRKLVVSHVENATTLYAYTEDDSDQLASIHRQVQAALESEGEPEGITDLKPDQQVAAKVSLDGGAHGGKTNKTWVRATIEQKGAGPKLKVKAMDIGSTHLVAPGDCRRLPSNVDRTNLVVACLKYKMADLKPKGRDDGFSAQDREAGADWLRSVIGGRTVKAKCHKVLNYKGGIMFDGEVNGHNLNLLALKQGFAKPNPEVFGYHAAALSGGGHHGIIGGRGPTMPPQAAMTAYASWDRDYYDYQQIGAGNKRMNGQQKFPSGGGGKTPAQQRLRQPMMPQSNGSGAPDQVQKLKSTVLQLESTLSKRNKEIASLKKQTGESGGKKQGDFTELAKSVEAARTKNKGQDTSLRVKTIVTQLQEAAAALKILENEKLVEAERSTIMFFKCQDEVGKLVGKHAKKSPLHKSLNNAKDSVRKCVGEYLKLTQELDLVCSSLQQILENDPLIPRPVIHTVDVTDRSKRIELVENAVETAGQWIEANQEKDPNLDKSNSDLEDLCHGMEQIIHSLKSLNRGEALSEPLPDINQLLKVACQQYGAEVKANAKKEKASSGEGSPEGPSLGQVMTQLAKAIHVCIHVKELLDKNLARYNEVYDIAVVN